MKKRIYYHDSDAGGVVYYANYLKYMEEARTDFLVLHGFNETEIDGKPIFFPVRQCNVTYHKPAFYGDTIHCSAEISKTTPARIIFSQKITNVKTSELLVEAEVTLACVSANNFKPVRLPKDIRNLK